jgi:hypothetical protein
MFFVCVLYYDILSAAHGIYIEGMKRAMINLVSRVRFVLTISRIHARSVMARQWNPVATETVDPYLESAIVKVRAKIIS